MSKDTERRIDKLEDHDDKLSEAIISINQNMTETRANTKWIQLIGAAIVSALIYLNIAQVNNTQSLAYISGEHQILSDRNAAADAEAHKDEDDH